MNYCRNCKKEIPEGRHMCDECKTLMMNNDPNLLHFSPNNKHVKRPPFKSRVFFSALASIAIVAVTTLVVLFFFK